MPDLHFAHLTDIHISSQTDSWGTLGTLAEVLFKQSIAQLNRMPDLDFVLITGDVMDAANEEELDRFKGLLGSLKKPWHFIPGNHDGFIDPAHPDALKPHEAMSLIDLRMAQPVPYAQKAYWSRSVAPGVQLVGLDSRYADTWNGVISPEQLAWLQGELDQHMDDLVILTSHHPLHLPHPRNQQPWWSNFVVDNWQQVGMLLDAYPQVRLVLAGHHHIQQIRRVGPRLHVNTAALSGYPCVYRLIALDQTAEGWQARISTHEAAKENQKAQAYHKAISAETIIDRFDPEDNKAWAAYCNGEEIDQGWEGLL